MKLKDLAPRRFTRVNEAAKGFQPGDRWSADFDYVGMLQAGVNAPEALFENIDHLNLLYESFTDVNYHTEAKDLGSAIEWIEDADGEEDIEKANDFLFRFRAACAKTLKSITKGTVTEGDLSEGIKSNIMQKWGDKKTIFNDLVQFIDNAADTGGLDLIKDIHDSLELATQYATKQRVSKTPIWPND